MEILVRLEMIKLNQNHRWFHLACGSRTLTTCVRHHVRGKRHKTLLSRFVVVDASFSVYVPSCNNDDSFAKYHLLGDPPNQTAYGYSIQIQGINWMPRTVLLGDESLNSFVETYVCICMCLLLEKDHCG